LQGTLRSVLLFADSAAVKHRANQCAGEIYAHSVTSP
jgi:hypothetical protein